jgi:acetoin utilization deacetylase AcuC-like enzyme
MRRERDSVAVPAAGLGDARPHPGRLRLGQGRGPPQELSPSAHKPSHVVESWLAIAPKLTLIEPSPVTIEQLCLAHDRDFVTGILAGRLYNGFGTTSKEVAASLPYTSGAMLAAARAAIAQRTATIAPCSGFHHASFDEAAGFCTFNGLMVTARVLLAEGLAHRVGIFDADMHYGDGTDDILNQTGETRVEHCTVGEHYTNPGQAETFLNRLPMMLRRFEGCDVLLYQAGADPHIDDPLGGWLTTEQLALRDRMVFEHCASRQLPVAWNLAGGYQTPLRRVLDIHDGTLRMCLAAYPDSE